MKLVCVPREVDPFLRNLDKNKDANHNKQKFSSFHNLQGNNLWTYLLSFWANALVEPVEVWLPEL